jgi:mono/diheme cytochrome c family protein
VSGRKRVGWIVAGLAAAAVAGLAIAYALTGSSPETNGPTASTGSLTVIPETAPPDIHDGRPAVGRPLFTQMGCGSCHTLAASGANGKIGPDLDADPPGFDLVLDRVTNGTGGMPSFKKRLSERQIRDLAAYVVTATH